MHGVIVVYTCKCKMMNVGTQIEYNYNNAQSEEDSELKKD